MLSRRLIYWWRRKEREAELRAEMEQHLSEKADELRAEGAAGGNARAAAERRFGNQLLYREEAREAWIARYWTELTQDMRYGMRQLWGNPGFTVPALAALTLGIGVNVVLFQAYSSLAMAPWAIRDADSAVQIYTERKAGQWVGFSWPHFRYLQAHSQTMEGIAAFSGIGVRVGEGEAFWTADISAVSGNYFHLIGTGFALGRGFSEGADDDRDPAAEVVMPHGTWAARYGSDPGIMGRWLTINGHRLQVVGVAAPGFNGPSLQTTDLWIPRGWRDKLLPGQNSLTNPAVCCVSLIGRVKAGLSEAAAQAELTTLGNQYLESVKRDRSRVALTPPTFLNNPTRARSASGTFQAMGAAAILILLLGCANVANLQLARATARRREIAVRLSLGAGRGRILRQLLAEGLLLAAIAGAAGLAVSSSAARGLAAVMFGSEERIAIEFTTDWRVALAALVLTMIAAAAFSLTPALNAVGGAAEGLRGGGRATSGGRTRSLLLAAQLMLCAILLNGTALLVRAMEQARSIETGFDYSGVVTVATGLEESGVRDETARALLQSVRTRAESLPGVTAAAWASTIPYADNYGVSVADPRTNEPVAFGLNEVSANFLDTVRIPLLRGRGFTTRDESAMNTVILNEAAARRLWPDESAVGKTIRILPTLNVERKELMVPLEIVGVVRNFGGRGIGTEEHPYACLASAGGARTKLLIRHEGEPGALIRGLPGLAKEIDRRFFVTAVPYSETIARAFRASDVSAAVATVAGMLSLLLACVGIYGVTAFNVSQQQREVGVRLALGARPAAILTMVLRQTLKTAGFGALAGIVLSMAFGNLLTGMLYGVKPTDPVALGATAGILVVTSAVAALGPARRAAGVDPAVTLRHE